MNKLRTLTPPFGITSKTCHANRRSDPTPNDTRLAEGFAYDALRIVASGEKTDGP